MDFLSGLDNAAEEYEESEPTPRPESPVSPPPVAEQKPPTPRAATPEPPTREATPAAPKPEPEPVQQKVVAKPPEPEVPEGTVQRLFDTPRTHDALKRSGITSKELQVKSYQDFYVAGDLPEKQRMRFNHYESRRQEKLNMVLQERAKVIAERVRQNTMGDTVNFQSLQLMEGLLDSEAKRLEKSLRSQLRYHQSVERENAVQLGREANLQTKLKYRTERRAVARSQYEAKTAQLKAIQDAKHKHSAELADALAQQFELTQAKSVAALLDEEVRLQEFAKQKEIMSSEKSERWKAKLQVMKLRKEEEDLKEMLRGEKIMQKAAVKLEAIELKQEETKRSQKVKHEEEALKLVDAKSKIDRLRRKDEYRRDLVRDHILQQEERVETLMELKNQILDQRKARVKQQAVMKGRAHNIRHTTPGPGHYQPLPTTLREMPVPKISNSKVINTDPRSMDMMVKRSSTLPPPGSYDPRTLPSGNHLAWEVIDGMTTKIAAAANDGPKKTFVDDECKIYRRNPGPGTYEPVTTMDLKHSVRIERNYIPNEGKPPAWCKPVTDTPAPDEYCLDKFTKLGRIHSGSTSAPSLGKALKMSTQA